MIGMTRPAAGGLRRPPLERAEHPFHGSSASERGVVATILAVLSFRASADELARLDHRHLGVGLGFTWLAGMGRY